MTTDMILLILGPSAIVCSVFNLYWLLNYRPELKSALMGKDGVYYFAVNWLFFILPVITLIIVIRST